MFYVFMFPSVYYSYAWFLIPSWVGVWSIHSKNELVNVTAMSVTMHTIFMVKKQCKMIALLF